MPADFSLPTLSTLYTTYLATLKERDVDALTLCVSDPSNIPAGAMKWNRAGSKFQEYVASAWEDKVLSLAGGGTGAITAAAARTALGLGSLSVQDSSAVTITGGTISGVTAPASIITSGTIAQDRLGTGSGGAGDKFLADDQTYRAAPAVLTGSGMIWFTAIAPSGYLICDGSAVSRTTYSALFGVIGTIYGVGDGSTTFNLPDFRQRFPLGKAASGTGGSLAGTGGAIDHTHTGPSHTHSISSDGAHTHTGPSHTHTAGSLAAAAHTHQAGQWDTSNGASHTTGVVGGSDFTVSNASHVHSLGPFDTGSAAPAVSGTTDASGTGATSSDGAHTHTGATGAGGTGASGTNNPPFLVINYIIKT